MRRITPTLTTLIAVMALTVGLSTSVSAGDSVSEPTEHVIEITGFKYIPESLSVKAGDTITWINKDIAPHTATADDASFDTGTLNLNESGSITVTADQTIAYFCKYHPMMRANISLE